MSDLPDIYIEDTAHQATIDAANLLASALSESSGKTAPTVYAVSAYTDIAPRAIIVGFAPDGDLTGREEYVIKVRGLRVHLYGVDEFDPNNPDLFDGSYSAETGWQYSYTSYPTKTGSADAVMYFLTKYIGMIWAFPGELGKFTPRHGSMKIPIGIERRTHHAIFRNCLRYSRPTRGYGQSGQGRDVLKFNRCYFSGFGDVAHGWNGYFDKYHPDGNPGGDRPELFALQPDGSRGFPKNNNAKICLGEPATVTTWLADTAQAQIATNPLDNVLGCGMQDSHANGHCVDPRSLAMDYTGEGALPFQWSGSGGTVQGVALADRHVAHANRINSAFRAANPSLSDWMIATSAYGPSRPAPKGVTMADGVYCVNVANCMNDWQSAEGQYHRTNMAEWCATGKNFWRPNLGNGHGHQRGMWLTQVHGVGTMLREWGENCIGVCPDYLWEHWATQWPMYYSLIRWQVDPDIPVDTVLDDAYFKLFGAAWTHIKALYEATEAVIEANPVHNATFAQMEEMWTPAVEAALQGHIDAAKAAVSDPSTELERIEWVEEGLRWSKDIMRCIRWHNRVAWPYDPVDGTELATNANAMEDDSDGIAGWTFHSSDPFQSQAEHTNGSNFAIVMSAVGADNFRIADRLMPGTSSDLIEVQVDVKAIDGDGRLVITERQAGASPTDHGTQVAQINFVDTNWQRLRFLMTGGNSLRIRANVSGKAIKAALDNLSIKYVEQVDTTQIEADWSALVSEMEARQGAYTVPKPIGDAAARGGRIPAPGAGEPGPDDPGLI